MIHKDRVFNIKTCSADEMIADFQHTRSWTLCSGWQVGDTLYLNDAFSEDGAQDCLLDGRAVVRVNADTAVQFDSVTFGSLRVELDRIEAYIRETRNCDLTSSEWKDGWRTPVQVHDRHGHNCPLCA